MEPRWQPTTFPTPRHERVHNLLRRLVSEGAARFFADACEIEQRRPPFRTTTHLVGHLIRDVESATRQVLRTLPKAAAHLAANPVPDEAKAKHKAEIDAVLQALDLDVHRAAIAWRSFVGDDGWHRTAHRDDLRSPRTPDAAFGARLDLFVDVLLVVLDGAEAKYADVLLALDVVLAKPTPSATDLKYIAVHLAPGATALAHVFKSLSASWFRPLRDLGVFKEPADIQEHDGGSFSFPSWPQAQYLSRIAPDLPADVAATIECAAVVDNESVHVAFLEAGARMPAAEAARVAHHEASWLGNHGWRGGHLQDAVKSLVAHLLEGNELDSALVLLRAALSLSPPDESSALRGQDARVDSWSYGQLLGKVLPALAGKAPAAARDFLFELICSGNASGTWVRRRRIESGGHPGIDEPLDILFAQLRDLYVARAAGGEGELRSAIAELEAKHTPLYDGLALHLLRLHGGLAPDLVVERCTDPKRLTGGRDDDEITLMIRDRFAHLAPDEQSRVVDALRENASLATLRQEFEGRFDDEKLHRLVRHRLLKWFHVLGAARPAPIAEEYAALVAEFGAPEPRSWGPMHGPNPPLRVGELLDLSNTDLIAYLRDWVPASDDPFEPSREGLGQEIKVCVTQEPGRFSGLAREFRGLAPPYVANLIWGVHEITQERTDDGAKPVVLRPIDWDSLLDLLEWTSVQATTGDGEDAPGNWTWARRMSVDLTEDVLAANADIDGARTKRAWAIMRSLMRDPDPSTQREGERGDDIDTFALNTVRGQALHAAIRIAATLASAKATDSAEVRTEVLQAIERRSDTTVEPSVAVRCVLAMRFNTLYDIDRALALALAARLFPTGADASDSRRAAWRSFLMWNSSVAGVFDMLREPYDIALDAVGSEEPRLAAKLGDHMAWLVVRGAIGIDDDSLRLFVERATPAARHHALDDVGRAIHQTVAPLNPDVVARLRGFWEWWAEQVMVQSDASDLKAFGWWFASKPFDPAWSLPALERVLDATRGRIDLDHEVLGKLANLAPAWATSVAACLGRIVNSADEWHLIRNQKAIRGILQGLLATAAAQDARTIASRLVARGWPEFRSLT